MAEEIISRAEKAGYSEMVLDMIVPLTAAIHLCKKPGFEECKPYYGNPIDDVICFKKILEK